MPIPVMKGYASLKTLPEEKLGDKVSPELKDALKGLFNR